MTELHEQLKALEARIAKLEENGDFRWEQSKKNFLVLDANWESQAKIGKRFHEIVWGEIQRLDKLTRLILEDLHEMQNRCMRYDEVYYRVFPDRWDQDVKVAKQFKTAISKPDNDDDLKEP